MNYNNVTDALRKWCDDFMYFRHAAYRRIAPNPFAHSVARGIRYRLGTLVDAGFSWIIYFSHEYTVSFAGTIVPGAMKILLHEKAHWNRPEWDA